MRNPKDAQLTILETLEDTPFYARSVLSSELLGDKRSGRVLISGGTSMP